MLDALQVSRSINACSVTLPSSTEEDMVICKAEVLTFVNDAGQVY